ncbi:hypothetical protein KSC_051640 [Ktedonobacter sp. SOSP1-52]|uniref:AI-2E family transporter n=1 Tax=Ktedonobacter sp. SOSP1-52 TaxID=2778366 RepID=UPI0019163F3B|nr:AI-2E family transporter [Ktedonobacter sp. SOSP1-52]GHO66272.1 hypothetical protein KSC_051640 [Ktedonobacter sp. SOSP1-52]
MGQINWQRTRDILICIICVGLIFSTTWALLGQFVDAIIILLLSMAVAFLLTPLVNFLVKYHVPRAVATLLVYVVVLGALGYLTYLLAANLIVQSLAFSDTIKNYANALPENYKNFINYLHDIKIPQKNIDDTITSIQSKANEFAFTLTNNALSFVTVLVNALINIFLIVVLSFYLTVDGKRIRDSLVSLSPKRFLPNVLLFEDALSRVVGNYIRGQLTLALIVGILVGVICAVNPPLGKYALICGVLAFLFETIPMVGPALASIMPLLLSLLLPDPFPRTLIVAGCFIVLQVIESNILGPRIVGHAVGLHPVAAILSLLVGAQLFGVFGALLATPVVAALWVVVASIYRSARGESADQILARKRAPWTIRRPNGQLLHKRPAQQTRSPGGSGERPEVTSESPSGEISYSELLYEVEQEEEKKKKIAERGPETTPPSSR